MSYAKNEPWYCAVANGHRLGIFTNVDEALESTFSFSGWQKCGSFDEAEDFLHANGVIVDYYDSQRHNGTWPGYNVMDPNGTAIVAFCDGSALRNGRADCTAAYAALFPHHPEWDDVEVLGDAHASSNGAEYSAALAVMRRAAAADPNGIRPVIIFTDSELLVNTMYLYIGKWLRNGWINANGNPVKNRDLIEEILNVAGGRTWIFRHVRAHTGLQEWEYAWNSKADNMAREAARSWDKRFLMY